MTRFLNYVSNAKVIAAISDPNDRRLPAVRLCYDLAQENLAAEEAIVAAIERVEFFISEELECRQRSLLPTSETGDQSCIDSAKAALRAANQIKIYLGAQGGAK